MERPSRPPKRAEAAFPIFLALLLLILLSLSIRFCACAGDPVLAVDLDGAITPASDDVVLAAVQEAESGSYQALMLILNTPGGGLAETTEILAQMEKTRLPVIGYVYPESAYAWSAGTMILLGSDVAAMAPHTIIGSAQPVQLGPTGSEPINDSKTINAVVALIEEQARRHGRNTTAAREFVLSNLNLNADQAREYGVDRVRQRHARGSAGTDQRHRGQERNAAHLRG